VQTMTGSDRGAADLVTTQLSLPRLLPEPSSRSNLLLSSFGSIDRIDGHGARA
jgi:hypothetical protein